MARIIRPKDELQLTHEYNLPRNNDLYKTTYDNTFKGESVMHDYTDRSVMRSRSQVNVKT